MLVAEAVVHLVVIMVSVPEALAAQVAVVMETLAMEMVRLVQQTPVAVAVAVATLIQLDIMEVRVL
jgi:hypothetical protein